MRLVACSDCHAQFDVTQVAEKEFACRCGSTVEVHELTGVDAEVHRCGACGAIVSAKDTDCDYCGAEVLRDTHQLSLICPECFARNRDESRFCTACGVSFQPEPIPGEGCELPCPCCSCLMPLRSVGGMGVNECPTCNGLWVPEKGFDQLVKRAIEAQREKDPIEVRAQAPRMNGGNPTAQPVAYRACPACEQLMLRVNFRRRSGVILDRCHEHGTWLDADELEQIAGFILSGGHEAAREAEAETRAGEERRARIKASSEFSRVLSSQSPRPYRSPTASVVGSLLELLTAFLR